MRFTRYTLRCARTVTPGRVAAARRAVQRDLDSVPLFPHLAHDPSPEARLARISAEESDRIATWRSHRAAQWRRARRTLAAVRPSLAAGIRRWWAAGVVPADPSYLLDSIWQALHRGWCPWRALATSRRFTLGRPVSDGW